MFSFPNIFIFIFNFIDALILSLAGCFGNNRTSSGLLCLEINNGTVLLYQVFGLIYLECRDLSINQYKVFNCFTIERVLIANILQAAFAFDLITIIRYYYQNWAVNVNMLPGLVIMSKLARWNAWRTYMKIHKSTISVSNC